jgi:hypothetical protein
MTAVPSLNLDAVERLIVYHLDETVATPAAIRPEHLRSLTLTRRFESSDPEDIRAAYEATCESKPAADPDDLDARWGILFLSAAQEPLLAAYVDRFGVQGAIDEDAVCFARPALLQWLRWRFIA